MCGRTACTLGKESIICACRYFTANGDTSLPAWKDIHHNNEYNPSFNMSIGRFTPVLIKSSHLDGRVREERTLCPMKWGLIPSWYHGGVKFQFKRVNCRIENLQSRKSCQSALQEGRRCVILADGFFERKKMPDGKKQAYFIYPSQSKDYEMKNRKWTSEEQHRWCSSDEWHGPDLLAMAGLFDIWKSKTGELLYSYTIITVKSSSELSWLHHRMPAILKKEDIGKWLDCDVIPSKEAIKLLHPTADIQWYMVSSLVNNARNQGIDCVLPITVKIGNFYITEHSWRIPKKLCNDFLNSVESVSNKGLTKSSKSRKRKTKEKTAEEPHKKKLTS